MKDLLDIFDDHSGLSRETSKLISKWESGSGTNTAYEPVGGTAGIFHIKKSTAMGVANDEQKEIIKDMSNVQFAAYMNTNPEVDAELSGKYAKKLSKKLEAEGVILPNLTNNEVAAIISNLYNYTNQPSLIKNAAKLSERRNIGSPEELRILKEGVTKNMDVTTSEGQFMQGLQNRRNDEKKIFNNQSEEESLPSQSENQEPLANTEDREDTDKRLKKAVAEMNLEKIRSINV